MTAAAAEAPDQHVLPAPVLRTFTWFIVGATFVYLINCYLTYWQGWPGVLPLFEAGQVSVLGIVQLVLYAAALVLAAAFAFSSNTSRNLRADAEVLNRISVFIIRASFWSVLLIGMVDAAISFLRVEGLLESVVGTDLAKQLGRSRFRGPYVHMPLMAVGIAIACFRQKIDFVWLAFLVVIAELAIVITRFIFSYEQAFMGDLVRFWYAALFLFASAYTLYSDAHVRVDVFYANFTRRTRGGVNAMGAIFLGMIFCWTILIMGMWSKSSILITPLLGFEVSQSGFGMYIKYLMASFLSIFAITMMIQFASSLLESVADYRGEPGARETSNEITH
ncbi:MAG: TRAP transporter small permease subunit [Pseudomonadota bacterium]